jgi:hypothetical protein
MVKKEKPAPQKFLVRFSAPDGIAAREPTRRPFVPMLAEAGGNIADKCTRLPGFAQRVYGFCI